uniref:nuclear transport factor 2 family protein n=1 Tax=Ferrimicrobium acidiphilum TaxID=121039 RepID=UPI0023F357BC
MSMVENEDLVEVVRREQQLLDPTIRESGQRVRELLHPDFVEYGASGRTWDRATVSAALSANPRVSGKGTDFLPIALADNVILLTYRIEGTAG